MRIPKRIDLTVFWSVEYDRMSYLSLTTSEIEEMIYEYETGRQAHLFTVVPLETIRQWLWDQLCQEPEEIIIDEIKY